MIKKFFKKITGLQALEDAKNKAYEEAQAALALAHQRLEEVKAAEASAVEAKAAEEVAKLSAKDKATRLKEPWVGVLETHVNKDNVRNGFFELDWNDEFVLKLKQEGYGFDGDPDEEIIDRWFRELCASVVVDGDFGGAVNTGVIDINTVKKNNK